MKTLNNILAFVVYTSIVVSLVVIIILNLNLFFAPGIKFSFSGKGILFYISQYGTYKMLFTLSIASIAAYSALNSLKESTKANIERLRQDRFTEWKTALDLRIADTQEKDPALKRYFTEHRFPHFLVLYAQDFQIKNISELEKLFKVYSKFVYTIEELNPQHLEQGGFYRTNEESYAFQSFKDVLFSGIYEHYDQAEIDLRKLYLKSINPNRLINPELYNEVFKKRHNIM